MSGRAPRPPAAPSLALSAVPSSLDTETDDESEFSQHMDNLSPNTPSENEVRLAFEAVDANGSGTLDRSEVRKLCESLGLAVDGAILGQIMAELDTDASGEVDFSEFSSWWLAGDDSASPIARSDDALSSSGAPASKEIKKLVRFYAF